MDDHGARLSSILFAHSRRIVEANAQLKADVLALLRESGGPLADSAAPVALRAARGGLRLTSPLQRIIRATAALTGFSATQLTGQLRTRQLAHARQMAMAVAHERAGCSMQLIGLAFGGRDHSTVAHAVQAVHARMTPELRAQMDLIAWQAGFPAREAAE